MYGKGMEERMNAAVIEACRSLRTRHKLEEGAHAPALTALAKVASSGGAELQMKVNGLHEELAQTYRAHAQASEQLVTALATTQKLHAQISEKEALIVELQDELATSRSKMQELESKSASQYRALEAAEHERKSLKLQVQDLETKISKAELDSKVLVDRWLQQKMQEAECLNEANAMYKDMMERQKGSRLEELARQQVNGIVRHGRAGAELYYSGTPRQVLHTIQANEGEVAALAFENSSGDLFSGGHDYKVRKWDTTGGSSLAVFSGCLRSVLDLSVSVDNRQVLAACADHKLYLWDIASCRLKHTLTGHTEKVVSVDLSEQGSRRAVSASHDRSVKLWDIVSGYGLSTIFCHSNCNAVCIKSDGGFICSGHMDGNLRFWDIRSGKLENKLSAHAQSITSVSISGNGNTILTSGRDNVHHLFDLRTLDILDTFRSASFRAATNWTRSCLSPNENFIVAGSADGTVVIWSRKRGEKEVCLKGGHTSPIVACAWSGVGKPLATGDKSGRVCIWD